MDCGGDADVLTCLTCPCICSLMEGIASIAATMDHGAVSASGSASHTVNMPCAAMALSAQIQPHVMLGMRVLQLWTSTSMAAMFLLLCNASNGT